VSYPAGPLLIPPLPAPPNGVFAVPGSKSITNRALVLAALAQGSSRLHGVLHSDDTRHMRAALQALGVAITDEGPTTLRVDGGRERLRAPAEPIFVGNSGTTVRFVAALCALVDGTVTLIGDAAMARRPILELVDGMRQLGVDVTCDTGCPPLTIRGDGRGDGRGGRLGGGLVRMRGDRSSQYFSALMMAATLADGDVAIEVEGELVSRPYIDITARMMADFGGDVSVSEPGQRPGGNARFEVRRRASFVARDYVIEPDASSASYPFALAAASGGKLTVPGLGQGALQGDYRFVDILADMGARVSRTATETTVEGTGRLRGVDVDMHHISDTVMTLAAIAPACSGPTTIRNVANIRIKETDRLTATVDELRRLGQIVAHGDDWLRVEPATLRPATVRSYADHRMAMSFAVLGAVSAGISIEDPACVAKTYPDFWHDLAACYPAGSGRPGW
jgi:3-phosphoshikimate 1-carboxyvinyltransferase